MSFRLEDLVKDNKSKRILKKFKKDRADYGKKKSRCFSCPCK